MVHFHLMKRSKSFFLSRISTGRQRNQNLDLEIEQNNLINDEERGWKGHLGAFSLLKKFLFPIMKKS